MGKVTIVSEQGDGEYTVKHKYDIARAQTNKRNIERDKAGIDNEIIQLGVVDIPNKSAELDAAIINQNNAIVIANGDKNPDGTLKESHQDTIANKTDIIIAIRREAFELEFKLNGLKLKQVANQKELDVINTAFEKYEDPDAVTAWCTDLTLELATGKEVDTLDISDETNAPNNQPSIISPAGNNTDNIQIQPAISAGNWAIAYNLTSLPGYQRHAPRYKAGVISAINSTLNQCTVKFDGEYQSSGVEGYDKTKYPIFQGQILYNVPIDYMTCHAAAFSENDDVIVKFNRLWTEPTVIGFVDHPKSCGIYMESGILDVLSVAVCTEDAFLPAVVNYGSVISAYINSIPYPMQGLIGFNSNTSLWDGEQLADGFDSSAVGCSVKTNEVTDECMNTYNTAPGGYCSASLITRKQLYSGNPASVYTGKLRLFVQSVMGTKRTDFAVSATGVFSIGGFDLGSGMSPSFGLLTTTSYQYFITRTSNTFVTYLPLIIQTAAQLEVDRLNDPNLTFTADDIRRIESYILSTAVVDEVNTLTSTIGFPVVGGPWYYGWHWTQDGMTADVVTNSNDLSERDYLCNHYGLSITHIETLVDDVIVDSFTSVVSLKESAHWWPTELLSNVIIPFPSEGTMIAKTPVKNEFGSTKIDPVTTSISNVLIHVHRTQYDELIETRYSQNFTDEPSTVDDLGDNSVCANSSSEAWGVNEATIFGIQGTNSLTCGSTTLSGTRQNTTSTNKEGTIIHDRIGWDLHPTVGNDTGNFQLGFSVTCDGTDLKTYLKSTGLYEVKSIAQPDRITPVDPLTELYYGESNIQLISETSGTSKENRSSEMFLEIPYDDCSSVIIGQQDVVGADEVTRNETDIFAHENFTDGRTWYEIRTDGSVDENFPTLQNHKSSLTPTYTSTVVTNTDESVTKDINLYVYDGFTASAQDITLANADQSLAAYFDPQYFTDPKINHVDAVRTSTLGAYYFVFATDTTSNFNFQGTVAIGWA